jgi:hypothetical protein
MDSRFFERIDLVLFPESPFHSYQIFYRQAVCSHLPTIQVGYALRTAPDNKIFSMTERVFREIALVLCKKVYTHFPSVKRTGIRRSNRARLTQKNVEKLILQSTGTKKCGKRIHNEVKSLSSQQRSPRGRDYVPNNLLPQDLSWKTDFFAVCAVVP